MAERACGCAAPVQALPSSVAPVLRTRGHLSINREALRHALGGGVVVEHNDVPPAPGEVKGSGRPSVNVGQMWRYFTTSVYRSGDLPIIATREALQNGLDAIRMAIAARQIKKDQGQFAVTWDPASRTLSWADDGIGMDAQTILTKFLSLGDSGKGGASGSGEQSGGFGVAKAVILGVASRFRWEMVSRDNRAVADGEGAEIPIYGAPFVQGTKITVHDVDSQFDTRYDYARRERVPLLDRLREVLSANDLDIEIRLNGDLVPRMFSRRGGAKVAAGGDWGPGTTATVKAYRRMPGDRGGAYYIRLGGLFQYKAPAQRHGLPADIVVDLETSVRPGAKGYPLNAARDGLQDEASYRFSDLVAEIEKENETTGRDKEDEVLDAEEDAELSSLTQAALSDPKFLESMRGAAGGLVDYYQQIYSHKDVLPVASGAPTGTREKEDGPSRTIPAGIEVARDLRIASDIEAQAGQGPALDWKETADQLRDFLQAGADKPLSGAVQGALQRAAEGQPLDPQDAQAIERAISDVSEGAMTGGGGLLQVSAAPAAQAALDRLDPQGAAARKRVRPNPFAKICSLRISPKHYDRDKARRFKRNWQKWIPYLVVWDATLRMVAGEARIRRPFRTGFILNDSVNGLCAGGGVAAIYVHPDRFQLACKAHRDRPLAIAFWVHAIACHELTHLDGRMGEGHSEEFVAAREDLGQATAHLLVPLSALIVRTLSLPPDRVLCPQSQPKDVVPIVLSEILSLLADPPPGLDSTDVQSYFRTSRRKLTRQFSELLLQALSR